MPTGNTEKTSRDDLRAQLFKSRETKGEIVPFRGVDIELRPQTLKSAFSAANEKDQLKQVAKMIVAFCYVPGTDVRIFEDEDIDSIVEFEVDSDFMRLQEKITKMSGVDIEEAKKEIKDPL